MRATVDRTTVLARRNPTVKLALLFVLSLGTLFVSDPLIAAGLYGVALVAVRACAGITTRTLLLAQIPFALFGLGIFLVNALSRPGTRIWPDLPVRITVEGVSWGTALALRGLVIGVLTVGFLVSTPPRDLMVSLTAHGRVPARISYALLAGHRMLAAMPARWQTIRAAHAVRAPLDPDGRPRTGLKEFGRSAFSLLVVSIRASERIALALESRGLAAGRRTLARPVPLGPTDALFAVTVLGAFVGVALLGGLVVR